MREKTLHGTSRSRPSPCFAKALHFSDLFPFGSPPQPSLKPSPAFLPSLTHGGKGFPGCLPLSFPAVLLLLRCCCRRRRSPGSRRGAGSTSPPACLSRSRDAHQLLNMMTKPRTEFSTQSGAAATEDEATNLLGQKRSDRTTLGFPIGGI